MIEYIQKQIREHANFVSSFKNAPSAFSVAYYHPKTKKKITYSEMCSYIDNDSKLRSKKIIDFISKYNNNK